jgi:hypothetical protein
MAESASYYPTRQISFSPLSRGRLLCNYSRRNGKHVVIKASRLESYKQNLYRRLHPRSKETRKENTRVPHRIILEKWDKRFVCPNPSCRQDHSTFKQNAQFKCSCGDELIITRQTSHYY